MSLRLCLVFVTLLQNVWSTVPYSFSCEPTNRKVCFLKHITTNETTYELDLEEDRCIVKMEIQESNFPQLPTNLMKVMPFLKQLDVKNCSLEYINPKLFGTSDGSLFIPNLQTLILSDNQLTTIDNWTFSRCNNLEFLNIENNLISSIMEKAFWGLYSLSTLSLVNNRLTTLNRNVLMPLQKVIHLNLSLNHLTDLSSVCQIKKLQTLDLSFNKNLKIDGLSIENWGKDLTSLSLNGISTKHFDDFLDHLSQFNNLISININENSLNHLNFESFDSFEILKHLSVFGNNLTELPFDQIRSKFVGLKSIDIGGNPWECSYLELIIMKFGALGISVGSKITNQTERNIERIDCFTFEELKKKFAEEKSSFIMDYWQYIVILCLATILMIFAAVAVKEKFWKNTSISADDCSVSSWINNNREADKCNSVELNPIYETSRIDSDYADEVIYAEPTMIIDDDNYDEDID